MMVSDRRSVVSVGFENIPAGLEAANNRAASPVTLEEFRAALRTPKGVEPSWLKDRFDLLFIAGGAQAVRGLILGVALLQFIDERAHVRFFERVSERLGLKAVDATSFLLKFQKRAFYRYLGRLRLDQALEQFGDKSIEHLFVGVRAVEQMLQVFERAREGLKSANGRSGNGKDSGNG
jgi:hypothetical protein